MNLFKSNFLFFLPNIYQEKSKYFLSIYFYISSLFHHSNQTEATDNNHTWKTKKIDRFHCTTSSTAKLKYISITYPLRRQKKKFKLSKSTNSHSQFHSTHYELVNGGWHEAPRAWTKFTWREIYPTSTWNQLGTTLQSGPKILLFPNLTHTPLPITTERPRHSLQDAWWPAHTHKHIKSVTC